MLPFIISIGTTARACLACVHMAPRAVERGLSTVGEHTVDCGHKLAVELHQEVVCQHSSVNGGLVSA